MKLYNSKEWLEEKYLKDGLSTIEMAKLSNCTKTTIIRSLKKHNIPTRSVSEALTGKKMPEIVRQKIGESNKGKKRSREQCQRLSESIKSVYSDQDRKKEIIAKSKATAIKNSSYSAGAEKRKKTMLKKYGVEHALQEPSIKQKTKQTFLEKYGVEYPGQSKEIREKVEQTSFKKYGVKTSLLDHETREKVEQTNLKRYGVKNVFSNKDIQSKIKEIKIKKYGTEHPTQNDEIKRKIIKSFIKIGKANLIKGKLSSWWAKDKNISISQVYKIHKSEVDIEDYTKSKSLLESTMQSLLEELKLDFESQKYLKPYYADFVLSNHNLVIECDGLYWHSDQMKKVKDYHKKKSEHYTSLGYNSLFFRGDEINNKLPIVQSIILNKLGKSKKEQARKCSIKLVDLKQANQFFEKNHLMGNGSGRTYGLYRQNELVCCMQVRWKDRVARKLEVSRFCSLLNHSIAGGWSKLLKHASNAESPKEIITFVDARYGTGNYLLSLGWQIESNFLSFKWTNFKETLHRLNFPGNSGYEAGYCKIWDCGQIKFKKTIDG